MESYMIFASRRPSEKINRVLFFSFKKEDGNWSEPKEINPRMNAGQPFIANDGKYLFFQSMRKGSGVFRGLHSVSAKIIETLKRK